MRSLLSSRPFCRSLASYIQGHSPTPRTREYFYFIDHQGQLFMDDARVKNFITCFKDKLFLEFFFKRVKLNETGRYEGDFPYVSPCGRETNYIRCDDLPVVFTHMLNAHHQPIHNIHDQSASDLGSGDNTRGSGNDIRGSGDDFRESGDEIEYLCYGGTESLTVPFQPHRLHMFPESGRVYHPGPDKLGGVGLIKSSLAIELSRYFMYADKMADEAPPTGFTWRGRRYDLDHTVLERLNRMGR